MSGLLERLLERSGELPSPDDRSCGEADRPTTGRKGPAAEAGRDVGAIPRLPIFQCGLQKGPVYTPGDPT